MDYSDALRKLKDGHRVARAGWNGKGMWLAMTYSGACYLTDPKPVQLEPFIVMKTADNKFVPWLCSQTDAMTEDWEIVE